jgi:hypothetical protein
MVITRLPLKGERGFASTQRNQNMKIKIICVFYKKSLDIFYFGENFKEKA